LNCEKENKIFTAETGNALKKVDRFQRIPSFSGESFFCFGVVGVFGGERFSVFVFASIVD
jgi:hypothetical protein